jgi:glycosyltransferase involved in cell wall biosynthesis
LPSLKHILFISSWYPTRLDPTLGIFNKYFSHAAAIYNKVTVLYVASEADLKSDEEIEEKMEGNVRVVTVNYKKVQPNIPFISQLIKRKRVLHAFESGYKVINEKAGKPDLIQLNVVMPMGVAAYHLSKKYKIPYVVNENWSGYTSDDGNYKGLIQKYFTKKFIKDAEFIMPTSSYLKEAMLAHHLNGRYEIIPNVVNVDVFKPEEIKNENGTTLIHISSLNDREKNVSGLIRAFAKASEKQKDLRLKIVGEGIDKDKYILLVKDLELNSKVQFLGRLFSKDLVREINSSDALIMFSNYETFCLVIIEAFACGKPVITSNAGAIRTYMKPELGMMVEKRDEEALAAAILEFSKNKKKFDKDHIRNYAVENYSYENVGKRLDKIYELSIMK